MKKIIISLIIFTCCSSFSNGQSANYHKATENAVNDLKSDLLSLAPLVDEYTKSEYLPLGFVLVDPTPLDGRFMSNAQDALQQVIGVLRRGNVLGIRNVSGSNHSSRGDSYSGAGTPFFYTSNLGVRIKVDVQRKPEFKKYFKSIRPFESMSGDSYTGVDAFVARLDFLTNRDNPIPQAATSKNTIVKLSDTQIRIISSLWIESEKRALPLIEVLMRKFTGGVGMADLCPETISPVDLGYILGGLPVAEGEAFKQVFLNGFADGIDGEVSEIVKTNITKYLTISQILPYGSAERRYTYPDMIQQIFAATGIQVEVVRIRTPSSSK